MIRRILVPVDRSVLAKRTLVHAAEIAQRSGAELRLVHVAGPDPAHRQEPVDDVLRRSRTCEREEASEQLRRMAEEVRHDRGLVVETAMLDGPTATAICNDAISTSADLIVMGTHGRTGWNRAWIGSVADRVVREAPVPVFLVRAHEAQTSRLQSVRLDRVLVPLDGSGDGEAILDAVVDLLATFEAGCTLIRVVRPVLMPEYVSALGLPIMCPDEAATAEAERGARAYLDGIVDRLRVALPMLSVDARVEVSSSPEATIVAAAEGVNVVAMATRGRGALRLIVGSVADAVLRGTSANLLLVRRVGVWSDAKEGAHLHGAGAPVTAG
jgi:nucleotide-binding universal stress UspA family protein